MRRDERRDERGDNRGARPPRRAGGRDVTVVTAPDAARTSPRPRRRDRRGRGMRGPLVPTTLPLHRSRSEVFDDVVADAVDELEHHWAAELAGLEFAVEDVPPDDVVRLDFGPDTVADRGVALGRLFREGVPGIDAPTVVVYRRPVEARALDGEDRADLVFMVVVDLVAEYLGKDIDEIDPP